MTTTSKDARTRGAEYEAPVPVPKAKRTRGRPSDYEPDLVARASELAGLGHTMHEIAEELEVSRTTVWRWQRDYPDFCNAIKTARNAQDDRVEEALRINAVINGNPTAQIFWLKNRRPADWRDRSQTELIVPMDGEASEAPDQRALGLQVLAFLSGAAYDPDLENAADTPLLDLTANQREENEDGPVPRRAREPINGRGEPRLERTQGVLDDPDFDEPARGRDTDFDPGEL